MIANTETRWLAMPWFENGTPQDYVVIERDGSEAGSRTFRTVAVAVTRKEAFAIAHSRETLSALEGLLNAILEGEEPSEEERQRAFNAVLAAEGV